MSKTAILAYWIALLHFGLALTMDASSLIQHSPFLPPSYKQNLKSSSQKPEKPISGIEKRFILKGISILGNDYLFSIYDNASQKGEWIQAGIPYNGFAIKSYNPELRQIEFVWEGHSGTIRLKNDNASSHLLTLSSRSTAESNPAQQHSQITGTSPSNRERREVDSSLIVFQSHRPRPTDALSATSSGNRDIFGSSSASMESNQQRHSSVNVAKKKINSLSIFPRTTVNNPNRPIPPHLR